MKNQQSGFTVTELVITLGIAAVLILLVFNFMVNGLIQYTVNTNRANLLNSARNGLEIITNDIRLSANADEQNRWPDAHTPNGDFGWESDDDTLVLAAVAEDENRSILFADHAEYISYKNNIVYFVEGDKLYKRTIAAPIDDNTAVTTCPSSNSSPSCPADRLLLEYIQDFHIQYLDHQDQETVPTDARSVKITAHLRKTDFDRPVDVTYTTRMVFRND